MTTKATTGVAAATTMTTKSNENSNKKAATTTITQKYLVICPFEIFASIFPLILFQLK